MKDQKPNSNLNSTSQQPSQKSEEQLQNELKYIQGQIYSQQLQRALKKRGDTAVHCAVVDNDPTQLKYLIGIGLRVFNQSDADGATPLHWAAEVGSIECAQILLSHNADIDALNFMSQTPFHVAAEKEDITFGKFLLQNRARRNCRTSCKKCRIFVKLIERNDRNNREKEKNERQMKLEEQKMHEIDQRDLKIIEEMAQLDILNEIRKQKEELGGPFFNKKENMKLREQQQQYRRQIDVVPTQFSKTKNQFNRLEKSNDSLSSPESAREVEKIRPTRLPKSKNMQPQDNQKRQANQERSSPLQQIPMRPPMQRQAHTRNPLEPPLIDYESIPFSRDSKDQHELSPKVEKVNQKKRKHKKKKRDVEEIKTMKSKEELDQVESDIERYF